VELEGVRINLALTQSDLASDLEPKSCNELGQAYC
jgi:DNA-binding XRE family transcriptional regulator